MNRAFTCAEVFQRLDDYLDRELSSEEVALVEEHLRICSHCALDARFEGQVIGQLREKLRRISVPPGLLDSILETLRRRE